MVFKLGLVIMLVLASCVAQGYSGYVHPNKQLSYDRGYGSGYGYHSRDQWSDGEEIPGVVGKDYPIFRQVPWTRFVCKWKYPGYYADPEANCQAYHICQRDGRKDSFLCPNGTLFNQERLVCTWWYTVDCSRAQSFYSINEAVAKAMEEADRRITAEKNKLPWNYQREDRFWNKNWQRIGQWWNKGSIPIYHNQDLGFSKQPKFFAKSLPNANTRNDNSLGPTYTVDAKFASQQLRSTDQFYLSV